MELLEHLVFYTHLLGFAAVVGGLMTQWGSGAYRVTPWVLWGARWQLLSGLVLAGLEREDINQMALGIKFGLLLVLIAFFESRKRPDRQMSKQGFQFAGIVLAGIVAAALFVSE
jgi:hypothetical protein